MNGFAIRLATGVLLVAACTVQPPTSAQQSRESRPGEEHPVAAVSPFIDVHTHLEKAVAADSIKAAVAAMRTENSAKYLFLPSPFDRESDDSFDIELIEGVAKKYPGEISIQGGGGTLNPMIQESVHAGTVSPELMKKFLYRAQAIVRLGAVGFGELTAEHRPSASTPAYQSAPPDHPLFLLLADIAAENNLPITLHLEAVPETIPIPASWPVNPLPDPPVLHANIPALERLLAHNPRAKIVWAHAGCDYTGYRTPELSRRLLEAHSNLYMEIKVDPLNPGLNSPLDSGGKLKPDWLKLFRDFPDRFVIGSDQHYPMPAKGPQRWQTVIRLFNQLPPDLRRSIGTENAVRIYSLIAK